MPHLYNTNHITMTDIIKNKSNKIQVENRHFTLTLKKTFLKLEYEWCNSEDMIFNVRY